MEGRSEEPGQQPGPAAHRRPRPVVIKNILNAIADPSLRWEPFRDGVEICRLHQIPGGSTTALLRYAPGARLERHEHTGCGAFLVLSGSQSDDNGEHRAAALLIHPPGTSHAIASDAGCVVLAVWEKPVVFLEPIAASGPRSAASEP